MQPHHPQHWSWLHVPASAPSKQTPAKLCPQDQLTCGDGRPFLLNWLECFLRVTCGSFQQARGDTGAVSATPATRQLLHRHVTTQQGRSSPETQRSVHTGEAQRTEQRAGRRKYQVSAKGPRTKQQGASGCGGLALAHPKNPKGRRDDRELRVEDTQAVRLYLQRPTDRRARTHH